MNNIKTKKRRTAPSFRKRVNRPKKIAGFNPSHLVMNPVAKKETIEEPAWSFEEISLDAQIKNNLKTRGYQFPTPIQEKSLQHLVEGKDLLGIAGTGTGKTAAFIIPILEQLLKTSGQKRALVIVPTRELALQVEEEFRGISKGMRMYASCFIGGKSVSQDLMKLKKVNHLIVGTPGRLLDLINQRALDLRQFETLVLDEFDRMLDMGFINDVKKIIHGLVNRKQTMFFSATIDKSHQELIDSIMNNPVEVKVSQGVSASEQVHQEVINVKSGENKFELLLKLIDNSEFEKVLIFAETKRQVDQVGKKLNRSGIRTELIHGNKSQNYRINALSQFTKGKVQVLVATDIAARGLDVPNVTHVINYQVPRNKDSYIHRIGRTGRAGKFGKAFTFVD